MGFFPTLSELTQTPCPPFFHKLVVTILQTSLEPLPPKIAKYKIYKSFDEEKFRCIFKKRLNELSIDHITMCVFRMTYLNVLDRFASLNIITPILLTENVLRQSCKDQGFVMNILNVKLEKLG